MALKRHLSILLAKVLVSVLVGVLLGGLATTVGATTARLSALGMSPDWITDERETVRWYGSGVDHSNVAAMDLGRFDTGGGGQTWSERISGQGGGVHVKFDEAGKWGTAATYFHSEAVQGSVGHVNGDFPGGSIKVMYALPLGPIDLGAGFGGSSYYRNEDGDDTRGVYRSEYRHDLGFGMRWRILSGLRLELAGERRQVQMGVSDDRRGLAHEYNAAESFGVRGRLQVQLSETVTLVPLLDYTRDILDIYSLPLDDAAHLDGWLLRTGFAFLIKNPDRTNLFFSGEYQDGKDNHQSIGSAYRKYDAQWREWYSFHARAAVEKPLNSWLTLRASVQYRRTADSSFLVWPTPNGPEALDWQNIGDIRVETPLGLGVAVTLGSFTLDAAYNDKAPLSLARVPDANSPRESANFATLSLGYRF
jgi:hypothetical protein